MQETKAASSLLLELIRLLKEKGIISEEDFRELLPDNIELIANR